MTPRLVCAALLLGLGGGLCCVAASVSAAPPPFTLPAICSERPAMRTPTGSLAAERKAVEQLLETDPQGAVDRLCAMIPRVERERGADSVEMAWWVGSLGTPMIAFMERFDEAVPLLEYARPIFERRLGPYAPEVAEIHVAYAWIAQRQGRNAEGAAEWARALAICERTPGPRKIELQKALVGLAQSQGILRDFDAAKRNLARAQAILAENGETVSEAAAAIENTYINIAWREEDYAAVREHALAQISIEERMASPAAQHVPAYVWLGQSLERLDEFEGAERALRTALEIAERKEGAPLQRHYLVALTQLSGLLVTRGRAAEALPLAQRAVEFAEQTRGPDAPLLVRPLQFLAESQRALGDLPAALRTYGRAGEILARHRPDIERPWAVAHHRGLARVQLQLGERAAAAVSLERAIAEAADDPKLAVERAATLLALAGTVEAGDPRADEATTQALDLLRSRLPESHPSVLRAITLRCAREARAAPASAPNCAEAVARLERPGLDPLLRHDVHAASRDLAVAQGDRAAAYDAAIRALAAATALGTADPLWRAELGVARLLRERGDGPLSIFFGKQAIDEIEVMRGRFGAEDRQLDHGFVHDKVGVYREVADWLMEAGRLDEGLAVLQLLQREEFHEFVLRDVRAPGRESAHPPGGAAAATIDLTPAEQALKQQYEGVLQADAMRGDTIDRLARLRDTDRSSPDERRRLEALLADQREVEAARAQRIESFLGVAAGQSRTAPTMERSVQVLQLAREVERRGPGTAVAVYLLTDARLRILVATRLGQYEYETAVNGRAVRTSIGRYLDAIAKREDVGPASRSLYVLLAKPVDEAARRAGATRLVLWLDGALRYVPFAALGDGRSYLVDRYSLESYAAGAAEAAPSARASPSRGSGPTGVAQRRAAAAPTVRGLGLTRAVEGYAALPAMADELCDVIRGPIEGLDRPGKACPQPGVGAGALEGSGYADTAFTAARLRSVLGAERDFTVLHVGTHFSLRPGNARKSFLVLGDGERLTLDTIAALDFSRLQLVTLSACQSAMGGADGDDGREIDGLSGIVQRRGAQQVIASLWRVDDGSTAALMKTLYATLVVGEDAASALGIAQRALRDRRRGFARPYAHPFYWAGLRVSGTRDP